MYEFSILNHDTSHNMLTIPPQSSSIFAALYNIFIKTLGKQYRWCQIIIILQLGIYH